MWLACVMVAAAPRAVVAAQAPASSQPASQPSSRPVTPSQSQQQIRAWFEQLADPDADVRNRAIEHLKGLNRADLALLKKIVEQLRPLPPSQAGILRDIVTHVFIAGAPYQHDPNMPFIGLTWDYNEEDSPSTLGGIPVSRRVPGFSAYHMLREGDIITEIVERPDLRFDTTTHFRIAITLFRPGRTITLKVLRDGKELRVPILLRPRMLRINDVNDLNAWISEQQALADEYWEQNFAPVIGEGVL